MVIEGDEEKSVGEPFRSYRSSGLANLSDGIQNSFFRHTSSSSSDDNLCVDLKQRIKLMKNDTFLQ